MPMSEPVPQTRRMFVVNVRDGDEAAMEAARVRLIETRGLNDSDELVIIRQFGDVRESGGDLEYPMPEEGERN